MSAPLRILIVEDETLIALSLAVWADENGHEVIGLARTAAEAVTLADVWRPDAVFMDVNLGRGGDGVDAADEIHRRFGVRSIFISGSLDGQVRQRAHGCARAFIAKPFDDRQLAAALADGPG